MSFGEMGGKISSSIDVGKILTDSPTVEYGRKLFFVRSLRRKGMWVTCEVLWRSWLTNRKMREEAVQKWAEVLDFQYSELSLVIGS